MSKTPVTRLLLASPVLALGLLGSSSALAADAVVSPLVSKGVDPLVVLNLTSLIASELDFMGEYEFTTQLETMPSTMSSKCLASGSCLGEIARQNQGSAIVAGAVSKVGNKLDLYLVLAEDGVIKRSVEKSIPDIPSVIADSMGGYVKELVTGVSAAEEAAEATVGAGLVGADLFEEEDDFEVAIEPTGGDDFGRRDDLDDLGDFDLDDPEPEPRYEEPPPRRYSEPEPAPVASRDDDDDVMFAPVSAEEVTVEDVSFGSAVSEIVIDSGDDDYDVADDDYDSRSRSSYDDYDSRSRSSYDEDDRSRSSSRSSSRDDDWDDDRSRSSSRSSSRDDDWDDYDDRDRDRDRSSSRSSRYGDLDEDRDSRTSRSRSGSDDEPTTSVAGRVGVSAFQSLNFVTYGLEVGFMAADNVMVVGGVEGYASRREIPPALLEVGDPTTQWDTIIPFNVGVQYRMGTEMTRPYVGADGIFIPGYVQAAGGMATGLRARVGVDLLVADNIALNLNGSAGFWSGKDFDKVARDMETSGLVPQLSAGTVFRF